VLQVLIQAGNTTLKLMRSSTSLWNKEKMSGCDSETVLRHKLYQNVFVCKKMKCLHLRLGNPDPCNSPFKVKFLLAFQFPTTNLPVFRQ